MEDTEHVPLCTGHQASDIWHTSIDTLDTYLADHDTRPDLQAAILHCLNHWRTQQPIEPTLFPLDIQQAIHEQQLIGWKALLEGLPSKLWQTLQHQYYTQHQLRKSGRKWIGGLLLKLHHLHHNQWKHRNHIKHNVVRPQEQEDLNTLHQAITREICKGTQALLPGDRHHFRHGIAAILGRSIHFKKSWLSNVTTARQRYYRIRNHNNKLKYKALERSWLYQWFVKPPRPTMPPNTTATTDNFLPVTP